MQDPQPDDLVRYCGIIPIAAQSGHTESVRLLLAHPHANDNSVIQQVVENGHKKIVELIYLSTYQLITIMKLGHTEIVSTQLTPLTRMVSSIWCQ